MEVLLVLLLIFFLPETIGSSLAHIHHSYKKTMKRIRDE